MIGYPVNTTSLDRNVMTYTTHTLTYLTSSTDTTSPPHQEMVTDDSPDNNMTINNNYLTPDQKIQNVTVTIEEQDSPKEPDRVSIGEDIGSRMEVCLCVTYIHILVA